jgi:hypothetical protein
MGDTIWIKNIDNPAILSTKQRRSATACAGYSDSLKELPSRDATLNLSINSNIPVTEGFSGNIDSNSVAEFGNDIVIGPDSDELILMGKERPTPSPLELSDTLSPTTIPNSASNANKLNAAYNAYTDVTKTAINSITNTPVYIAEKIVRIWSDNMDSQKSKNDANIIAHQISLWIFFIVISYIVVINWWYIWTTSDFTFDLRMLILPVLHWSMSGPLNVFETFNYVLLNFRKDTQTLEKYPFIRSGIDSIWANRQITFTLFHLFVFLCLLFIPFGTAIESMMSDKGALFYMICGLSALYFVNLFITEQWYDKFMKCGTIVGYFILVALLIGSIFLMGFFIYVTCPLFTVYLLVLSFLFIFIIENVSVFSGVNSIFANLRKESKPTDNIFDSFINNFHTIYFSCAITIIVIYNCYKSISLSIEPLLVLTIVLNLLLFFIFGGGVGYQIFLNKINQLNPSGDSPEQANTSFTVRDNSIGNGPDLNPITFITSQQNANSVKENNDSNPIK